MLSLKISSLIGFGTLLGLACLNGAHAASGRITLYLQPNEGSGDGPCSEFWEFGTYDVNDYMDKTVDFASDNNIRYYQISNVDDGDAEACERLENHQDGSTVGYSIYTGGCSLASGELFGDCKNTGCQTLPAAPACLHIGTVICSIGSTGTC